jgi:hypothetical protein
MGQPASVKAAWPHVGRRRQQTDLHDLPCLAPLFTFERQLKSVADDLHRPILRCPPHCKRIRWMRCKHPSWHASIDETGRGNIRTRRSFLPSLSAQNEHLSYRKPKSITAMQLQASAQPIFRNSRSRRSSPLHRVRQRATNLGRRASLLMTTMRARLESMTRR